MAKDGCAGATKPAVIKQGSNTMKSWQLAVLALAPLAVTGCRTDPTITLLERDNYRLGQQVRRLRWQIDDLQEALNSADERCAGRERTREEREPRAQPRRNHNEPDDVGPPMTEPGTPTNKVPDSLKGRGGSLPPDIPPVPPNIEGPTTKSSEDGPVLEGDAERGISRRGYVSTTREAAVPFRPTGDSRRVAAIAIDRAMTGGIGADDGAGDKGLLVAIEPRDKAGRIVDAPGEVNVAAFDRELKGEAARVARWDFTAAETASLFRHSGSGAAAIHLAMGWPANPPKHRNLQLFVRYITADGRRLETNGPIEIALPGDRVTHWKRAEVPVLAEEPIRAERPKQREPAEPRRLAETPAERTPPATPHISSRTLEPEPERPVWSPNR
jgi:hypothetical protein